MKKIFSSVIILCSFLTISCVSTPQQTSKSVQSGDKVSVSYTVSLDTGEQIDQRDESNPLVFTIDAGEMLPKFNDEVKGMVTGEQKSFTLSAQEGYGGYDKEKIQQLNKGDLNVAQDVELTVNQQVTYTDDSGKLQQGKVIKVGGDIITIDFNNALSGKNLNFSVKLLSIEAE